MFARLTRRRALSLAVVMALAGAAVPSEALANEDPEYGPPPQHTTITDPAVRAITEDALAAFKYAFAVVASDPGYTAYPRGSLEARVLAGFATLPQERQALYVGEARRMVQAQPGERERLFGRHGRRGPEEVRRLGFDGLFTNVPFDRAGLIEYIRSSAAQIEERARRDEAFAMQRAAEYQIDPRILHLLTLKKLNLRLDLVKCVDETNGAFGSEWGSDEIEMGGVKIDHKAVSTKVGKFDVGSFDDGDIKSYAAPGKLFSSFDLTAPGAWGRTYTNVVMMAEEDGGGFADMLTDAWEAISDKITAEIIEAITSLGPGDPISAAVKKALAEVIAWLVDVFVGWVIGWFSDDLFPAVTYSVELPSKWAWLYTNPADLGWTAGKLPPVSAYFTGHGGKYKVNMHYEVVS